MERWYRRLGRLGRWVGLSLGLLLLTACGSFFGTGAVARVNGETISLAEYQREVDGLMGYLTMTQGVDWDRDPRAQAELPRLQTQVLESLIDQRLVRQQARQDGITIPPRAIEERLSEVVEDYGGRDRFLSEMQARNLDALGVRRSIEDSLLRERLTAQHVTGPLPDIEVRRVRHVLVDSAEKATAARQRLVAGETWEKVAAEVSGDPGTKDRGGDLGYLERGQTFPTFDQTAFTLPVNELSQPIQTPFGFHVLLVVDARTQRPNAEQIQVLRQREFGKYLLTLRQRATIQRFAANGQPIG